MFPVKTSRVITLTYLALALLTACVAALSCAFLLSQAVRTSPGRDWTDNFNAVIIGAGYLLILLLCLSCCLNRRILVRRRLANIPKGRVAVSRKDVPSSVQQFIEEEFLRSCAISYASLPKVAHRDGWGAPYTTDEGVRFRTALLSTVKEIDATARLVIPSLPPLRPTIPLSTHLRHLRALISADDSGEIYLDNYSNIIQIARFATREPTEVEFVTGTEAAHAIKRILLHYRIMQTNNPSSASKIDDKSQVEVSA